MTRATPLWQDGARSETWKCRGIERCEGDAEFLGGTGKYTGLKGSNTVYGVLRSAADPEGSSGYAVWKGTWQLPE